VKECTWTGATGTGGKPRDWGGLYTSTRDANEGIGDTSDNMELGSKAKKGAVGDWVNGGI